MPQENLPKIVIVSGAAAGLGRAIAKRFAKAGARIGLIARDGDALNALSAELLRIGAAGTAFAALDVADAEAVRTAAQRFEQELGPIELWINDAMVTVFSKVSDISAGEFRRVTEVTYLGTVYGSMAVLEHMRPRNRGHIINIGSALAYRGIPLQSAYCGAKHAIRGFTASLRSELSADKSRIAVSLIELPAMNTPQFDWARTHMPFEPKPMGTIYQPEAAAEAVFQAALLRPREYWVGLSTFMTIIGNMVVPDFMDWYLGRTAIAGQHTQVPVAAGREDNLLAPVPRLARTRGSFGQKAKPRAFFASGSLARISVIGLGALVFYLAGHATRLLTPSR